MYVKLEFTYICLDEIKVFETAHSVLDHRISYYLGCLVVHSIGFGTESMKHGSQSQPVQMSVCSAVAIAD